MTGWVIWFTGLPSAGKSTLAGALAAAIRERGFSVEVLDGDEVRATLTKGLGFSREDRDENIRRIAWVAKVLARNGAVAITAAISPYRAGRDRARQEIGRFVEVYVKCPLEICIQRDTKGLYARAMKGELAQFTGVSDPYEEPVHPEVVVETHQQSVQEGVLAVLAHLEHVGWLRPATVYVPIPAYVIRRLRRLWGDTSLESRLTAVLLHELPPDDEASDGAEGKAILGR